MKLFSVLVFAATLSTTTNAKDYWGTKSWRDDFTMGLWKGCIEKTLLSSGYFEQFGNITKDDLTSPKDPFLEEIMRGCDCQTEYFEDTHATGKLKSILSLEEGELAYSNLMKDVRKKCL